MSKDIGNFENTAKKKNDEAAQGTDYSCTLYL